MVRVETRRCGKYRTLLQIPKYGGQSESREEFLKTQSATFALRFAVLLSFKYWNTVRCRKRQHRSVFRFQLPRRGSFTPKRPCANRKCCARSTSPVGMASRSREGTYESTSCFDHWRADRHRSRRRNNLCARRGTNCCVWASRQTRTRASRRVTRARSRGHFCSY